MAEAFARAYGSDVLEARSAGISPASIVQELTYGVMRAKNISLDGQFPKDLLFARPEECDVIVNMSGAPLRARKGAQVIDWEVEDPYGGPIELYQRVRDQIEQLVMGLILRLRGEASSKRP